jgi:hypothetical protein
MDKLTIFQIDPDMVRHFLPSFARPEKDQITFLQVGTADFLAIMLQHISRRTCQLLSIDFTKHNRHKTGAIHSFLCQSTHPMRDAKPSGSFIV